MDAITGYEEYEQDFRLVSLPEYCWMAGQLLIEALEDYQPPEIWQFICRNVCAGSCPAILFYFKPIWKTTRKDIRCFIWAIFNHGKEDCSHETAFPPWKTYPPHG